MQSDKVRGLARLLCACLALGLASCTPPAPSQEPTPQLILLHPEDGMPPTREPATQEAPTPTTSETWPGQTPDSYPLPAPTPTPTGRPAAYP